VAAETAHSKKIYSEAELYRRVVEAGFRNDHLENMLHEAHVLLLTGQSWLRVDGVDRWLIEYEEIYGHTNERPDSAQETAATPHEGD
jgi:hypothetical protein